MFWRSVGDRGGGWAAGERESSASHRRRVDFHWALVRRQTTFPEKGASTFVIWRLGQIL